MQRKDEVAALKSRIRKLEAANAGGGGAEGRLLLLLLLLLLLSKACTLYISCSGLVIRRVPEVAWEI